MVLSSVILTTYKMVFCSIILAFKTKYKIIHFLYTSGVAKKVIFIRDGSK